MKSLLLALHVSGLLFLSACQNENKKMVEDSIALSDSVSIWGATDEEAKLVKTAGIEFKVEDVEKGAREVSALTQQMGGMIFHQSLASPQEQKTELKISNDSLLVISTIVPHAEITARIPSQNLEAFLYSVADRGYFTSNSQLHIDDKSLAYLENSRKQKARREVLAQKQGFSKKPSFLQNIAVQDELIDKEMANRTIDADVQYSLVDIRLFQNAVVKKEVIANHDLSAYGLPFTKRLATAFENGWSAFLNVMVALTYLWVFVVLATLCFVFYKRYGQKRAVRT